MKKILLLVGALAATVALSSCSKAPTRDEVKAEMQKAGITGPAVDCVTDKMIDKFGLEKLGSNADPTEEEKAAITEIAMTCYNLTTTTTPS